MNFCIAGYLRIKSSPNNAISSNYIFSTKYCCNNSFRGFYHCGLSKLKKSYVDAKEEPVYLYDNVYES